jgi:hypothetical protein
MKEQGGTAAQGLKTQDWLGIDSLISAHTYVSLPTRQATRPMPALID